MSANTTLAATGNEIIRYDWDALTSLAFDLLMDRPEGVTLLQLVDRLEVPEHVARRTINVLREFLTEDGDTNIIAVPNGRERRYQLVSESGAETDSWLAFNSKYVESRLRTVEQVYSCLVRAAKTERERDQAARILKQVQRLKEDVEYMNADKLTNERS